MVFHMIGDTKPERCSKKITYVDEKYLREAKEVLYDEFSLALDIDKPQVENYIINNINESDKAAE